jgi:hypothetical protein
LNLPVGIQFSRTAEKRQQKKELDSAGISVTIEPILKSDFLSSIIFDEPCAKNCTHVQ